MKHTTERSDKNSLVHYISQDVKAYNHNSSLIIEIRASFTKRQLTLGDFHNVFSLEKLYDEEKLTML